MPFLWARLICVLSATHSSLVSQMLQNSTTYYFHPTKIFAQLQSLLFSFNKYIYPTSTKIISFNKNIYSTSTKIISFYKNIYSTSTNNNFIQQQYLFNFNPNYFHSTKIFIQLQPKIISFNNRVPGPSKYRHSTKFPVPPRLNTKQHQVTQATYQKPVKYTTEPVFSQEMFALVLFLLYWSEVFSRVNTVTNLGKWRQNQK